MTYLTGLTEAQLVQLTKAYAAERPGIFDPLVYVTAQVIHTVCYQSRSNEPLQN